MASVNCNSPTANVLISLRESKILFDKTYLPITDKFEGAFASVITGRAEALVVLADGMFFNNHPRILAFTEMSRLPALFPKKEIAEAGNHIDSIVVAILRWSA